MSNHSEVANHATRLRPVIRLFVSSTFSDLKAERDALQKRVFPKLEQLCLKEHFQFQAIDLRWGVPTEAGLDHRTMRICFEELRRSQDVSPEPNFLILLGDRYGWRPLPEEISQDEFRKLEEAAKLLDGNRPAKTHGDALTRWYQLDENIIVPTYVFQRREKPQPDEMDRADYTVAEVWRDVEQGLWRIINHEAAFPASGLKDRFATPRPADAALPGIARFQTSATEQEIWCGALNVANAKDHVLAFFREIDLPKEIEDAEPLRDFLDVVSGKNDRGPKSALDELKAEIRKRLGDNAIELKPKAKLTIVVPTEDPKNVSDAKPKFTAVISIDHIDLLCKEVEERLTKLIRRQIDEYWKYPKSTEETSSDKTPEQTAQQRAARELEIEQNEHHRFGKERGSKDSFVGRAKQIKSILEYIENDSRLPCVVHGASGCGKTALLARVVQEILKARSAIVRYIGVTPRSSDLRSLLRSLCQELRLTNPIAEALSSDIRELMQEFRKHLDAATEQHPITLMIDAVDQLAEADNGRQLFWIPFGELPSSVKIVLSCLSDRDEKDPVGHPYVAAQRRRLPDLNMLSLDALSPADASALLFEKWLKSAGRTVTENQRALIELRLQPEPCRQPLYLKLLFEEVKLWRSYDDHVYLNEPESQNETEAAAKTRDSSNRYVGALLNQLFDRLRMDANHGSLLVNRALGYIAAARRGLTETEILEVLFADREVRRMILQTSIDRKHRMAFRPRRIPVSLWSRLRSDLAPYLTERAAPGGSVVTFYHRQVAEWIQTEFVTNSNWTQLDHDESQDHPHARLARFFAKQDYFLESLEEQRARARRLPPTPRPSNIRKVDELPWQLLEVAKLYGKDDPKSPHWDTVAALFTDINFLESKAEATE